MKGQHNFYIESQSNFCDLHTDSFESCLHVSFNESYDRLLLLIGKPGFADSVAADGEASLHRGALENAVHPGVEVRVLVYAQELSRRLPALVLVTDAQVVHPGEDHHVRYRVLLADHVGPGSQMLVQHVTLSLHLEAESLDAVVTTLRRAEGRSVDKEVTKVSSHGTLSRL